jgi:sarcosine oxidase subunit gamma
MPDLSQSRRQPEIGAVAGVRLLPATSRWILRAGSAALAAASVPLGVALPTGSCRSESGRDCAVLWLGPDEYLLLAPLTHGASLEAALEQALAGLPHSLVDVSHRQVALEIRGPHAATLLSAGCPLSLDPEDFPPGTCTRTLLGKADIVLWRTAAEAFHLEVWRSFASYVSNFLAEAAFDVDRA